jgi:hypothetical protein
MFRSDIARRSCSRSNIAGLAVALAVILFAPSDDHALGGCPDLPIDGNLTLIGGFLHAEGTCTQDGAPTTNWLTDGGYIRSDTPLTAHTTADTSGKCLWGVWTYPPGACAFTDYNDVRSVNHVNIQEEPPGLIPSIFWVFPADRRSQHLNTQVPGTTTGPLVRSSFSTPGGTWTYKFASIVNKTLCNIEPGESEVTQRQVEVVGCLPNFAYNDRPEVNGVEHIPLDAKITFSVPDGPLANAVSNAMSNWGQMLQPYAVFDGTLAPCAEIDPHCVQIVVAYPPDDPAACSQTVRTSPGPGGETTRASKIYVHPAYTSWTQNGQAYLNYLLNHEFGHLLGLRVSRSCAPSQQTIMAEDESTPCGEYPPGSTPAPTPSDALSSGRTPYGTVPRKACAIP